MRKPPAICGTLATTVFGQFGFVEFSGVDDGGEFGFGAEVGISTNKLHARGPMGINDLTTYKFKVYGKGQIRE